MSEHDEIIDFPKRGINWGEAALFGAASLLTLIEPRDLEGGARWGYKTAAAGLAGWAAGMPADDVVGDEELVALMQPSPFERLAVGTGVAGITFGLMEPLLKADAWMVDKLRDMGCKHPRILGAAITAVTGAVVVGLSARRPSIVFEAEEFAEFEGSPITPEVQRVVVEMLSQIDGWGAAELLEQFKQAEMQDDLASGIVNFSVPEDMDPVAVDEYLFPVRGVGEVNGVHYELNLLIEGGHLSALLVDPLEESEQDIQIPETLEYEVGVNA